MDMERRMNRWERIAIKAVAIFSVVILLLEIVVHKSVELIEYIVHLFR